MVILSYITYPVSKVPIVLFVFFACCLSGCSEKEEDNSASDTEHILIDFEKSNSELLLKYYLTPFLTANQTLSDLISHVGEDIYLDIDQLKGNAFLSGLLTEDAVKKRKLDWDTFVGFVERTYYERPNLENQIQLLYESESFNYADPKWFKVELSGVMTQARRHIYVKRADIKSALTSYITNGRRIIYPEGTVFIGEHWEDSSLVETTVMEKRGDGYWDFLVYDTEGHLTRSTHTPPKRLKAPIQCVGCHMGKKLFEPEKSFPSTAVNGPHGPRAIYVTPDLRNREVTIYFDEHRKRSDMILGIYGTLYVSSLIRDRQKGIISEEDANLLHDLGL